MSSLFLSTTFLLYFSNTVVDIKSLDIAQYVCLNMCYYKNNNTWQETF